MAALDYATPQPAARRVPTAAAKVLGWSSLVIFAIVLVCFVVGLVGALRDPHAHEPGSWSGLPYLFLMALPTLVLCPFGLLAGLFGIVRGSPGAWTGFTLNGIALITFFLWRGG
jgi:hypothetical protein